MTDDTAAQLRRKLQLTPGSRLWTWPRESPDAASLGEVDRAGIGEADVALIFAENRQDVDTVLAAHIDELDAVRAVWIVYAKGNRTDMNRDTLWIQLAEHGWKAVSQVAYSETLSALRVRALKDGEPSPV